MGDRYRKSINFGRYREKTRKADVAMQRLRRTKLAYGDSRASTYIPGTGTSRIQEPSSQKESKATSCATNSARVSRFKNTIFTPGKYRTTAPEALLNALTHYKYRQIFFKIMILISAFCCFCLGGGFFILSLFVFCVLSLYTFLYNRVQIDLICDKCSQAKQFNINSIFEILKNSHRVFEIKELRRKNNATYTDSSSVAKFSIKKRRPPFMKINNKCYSVIIDEKKLYFLSGGILVNSLFDLCLLSIKDIQIHFEETVHVEFGTPKDSKLIKHTWLHVNRKGGPDKKIKNNPVLNCNKYGVVRFHIPEVLDLCFGFSNYKMVPELEKITKLIASNSDKKYEPLEYQSVKKSNSHVPIKVKAFQHKIKNRQLC